MVLFPPTLGRPGRVPASPRFNLRPMQTALIPAILIATLGAAGLRPAAAADPATGNTTPNTIANSDPSPFTVVERSIVQNQGGWQLDYRLRYEGPTIVVASPAEIQAKVEGWVSNSRIADHAMPRPSSLIITHESGWAATGDVITSSHEDHRCRERATLQVWAGDNPDTPPITTAKPSPTDPGTATRVGVSADADADAAEPPAQLPFSLTSGALMRARLRLEHLHSLYGDYDPLLSQRTVELRLGPAVLRNVVPMEREQYLAMPRSTWPALPVELSDTRHFISAPDSLHLEAHVAGNEHYKFPDRPVRYATKMRLKYAYLIATGTDGGCRVRISQFKDTPTSYRPLYDAAQEERLTKVGSWVKVERIFRTDAEATTLALEFRLCDPNDTRVGEVWIDDVSLEPVLAGPASP